MFKFKSIISLSPSYILWYTYCHVFHIRTIVTYLVVQLLSYVLFNNYCHMSYSIYIVIYLVVYVVIIIMIYGHLSIYVYTQMIILTSSRIFFNTGSWNWIYFFLYPTMHQFAIASGYLTKDPDKKKYRRADLSLKLQW